MLKRGWKVCRFGHLLVVALLTVILSSCSDTPMTAKVPPAENDDIVWEGRKLRDWRRDLRAFRNVAKCSRASAALARAGKLAIPGLSKDVNDGSVFYVNVWAAKALFHIGSEAQEALPALEAAVQTAQQQRKSRWRYFEPWGLAALVKIRGIPDNHIEEIIPFLRDSDELVRINACRALGKLGQFAKPALPALAQATRDSSKSVQECAAESIQSIKTAL